MWFRRKYANGVLGHAILDFKIITGTGDKAPCHLGCTLAKTFTRDMKKNLSSGHSIGSRGSDGRFHRDDADSDASTRAAQRTEFEQPEFELVRGQNYDKDDHFRSLEPDTSPYARAPYYEPRYEEPFTEYATQSRTDAQETSTSYYNLSSQSQQPNIPYGSMPHQSYQQGPSSSTSPERDSYSFPAATMGGVEGSKSAYLSDRAIKSSRRLSAMSERNSKTPYSKLPTPPSTNYRKHKQSSSRGFAAKPDSSLLPRNTTLPGSHSHGHSYSGEGNRYFNSAGLESLDSQLPDLNFEDPSSSSQPTSIPQFSEEDCANYPSLLRNIAIGPEGPGQTFELDYPDLRVEISMWMEEGTLCLIVNSNGVAVTRRADNNMINATKLLNECGLSRGRRDSILKEEQVRYVVKNGKMPLKGVWVPYERAMELAQIHGSVERLYPLFLADLRSFLYHKNNILKTAQVAMAAARDNPEFALWKDDIPPINYLQK